MEFCEGGDLASYFEKRNCKMTEERVCQLVHKLMTAIYYLHSYGIVHRDLKLENILMTSSKDDSDIRVLDFGLSKIIGPNEYCNEPFGTIVKLIYNNKTYVAPEVLKGRPYSYGVDMWSLGIITYLLLSGALPFYHQYKMKNISKQILNSDPDFESPRWANISETAIDFVKSSFFFKYRSIKQKSQLKNEYTRSTNSSLD
jgi:serine/threonine protein kinase